MPGVAKTTMAKTLSEAIQAEFGRIQGTPDIEFKDIVGYTYVDEVYNILNDSKKSSKPLTYEQQVTIEYAEKCQIM